MKISALKAWAKKKMQSGSSQLDKNLIAEHNREIIVRAGRREFEKLYKLGLSIPVSLA